MPAALGRPSLRPYRGRFAPSPTGPLHLGSLYTALASYLQARSLGGEWYLRIDDIDAPRCAPGATEGILRTLEHFGLLWDGPVVYQSQFRQDYQNALDRLTQIDLIYPCQCTRKSLAPYGTVYPGFCRQQVINRARPHSLRIKTDDREILLRDCLQGQFQQQLNRTCGDFVVRRRDRIFAYHLTVVVDDSLMGISEVVRGSDLLDCTPRQIYLQQLLDIQTPAYMHLPVLTHANGLKLSKQTHAPAIGSAKPEPVLYRLLQWLGQNPPEFLKDAPKEEILEYAVEHWNAKNLPSKRQIAIMAAV